MDLLTPSLAGHAPRTANDPLPWRVESQVYVAILGGPLAVGLIAALNVRRLRMPGRAVAIAAAIAVIGTIAGVLAAGLIGGGPSPRLLIGLAGVATYGPLFLLQRTHGRVHSAVSDRDDDEDWASLWAPGFGAVVAGLVIQLTVAGAIGGSA